MIAQSYLWHFSWHTSARKKVSEFLWDQLLAFTFNGWEYLEEAKLCCGLNLAACVFGVIGPFVVLVIY